MHGRNEYVSEAGSVQNGTGGAPSVVSSNHEGGGPLLNYAAGFSEDGYSSKHGKRDDGLGETGGPFSGMISDLKRKGPHYFSDWADGLVFKSVAVVAFLYLACLTPAITFGALMGDATQVLETIIVDGEEELREVPQIGVAEMLIGTGIFGIIFAIFSGLPMTILGGTGPLLIFTQVLFDLTKTLGIEFLPAYTMIGLWTALLLILMAIFNVSKYMSLCTRFTDDVFAGLISTIFIYEAILQMIHALDDAELEGYTHEQLMLLGAVWALLMLGTCYLTFFFRDVRDSTYLNSIGRSVVSNFAPVLAIGTLALITYFLFPDALDAEEHYVFLPEGGAFENSLQRSWIVDISGGNAYTYGLSFIPALLAAILVFLDQNITARILNNPDFKLVKGAAYHWDIFLVALMVAAQSILGMPWLVAHTVPCLTHLQSNATYSAPDKHSFSGPRIEKVNDNRVTPLCIHILILMSTFFIAVLQYIPKALLGGMFLFMGIASLNGNQFIDRVKLMFMDAAVLTDSDTALSELPRKKIWLYTIIQLICLAILWAVKQTIIAISFPLFILLMIPVRIYLVPKWFTDEELEILDSEEEQKVEGRRFSVISKSRANNVPTQHVDIHDKVRKMSESAAQGGFFNSNF